MTDTAYIVAASHFNRTRVDHTITPERYSSHNPDYTADRCVLPGNDDGREGSAMDAADAVFS